MFWLETYAIEHRLEDIRCESIDAAHHEMTAAAAGND